MNYHRRIAIALETIADVMLIEATPNLSNQTRSELIANIRDRRTESRREAAEIIDPGEDVYPDYPAGISGVQGVRTLTADVRSRSSEVSNVVAIKTEEAWGEGAL